MEKYNVVNGTSYNVKTSAEVISILEKYRTLGKRIRVFYGDIETGKSWNEENDTTGKVGRSTGENKIPLLVNNARSLGGGSLLDHCIVKIIDLDTKRAVYAHPTFSQSEFTAKGNAVFQDGKEYAPECKSAVSAKRLAEFMNGLRHSK